MNMEKVLHRNRLSYRAYTVTSKNKSMNSDNGSNSILGKRVHSSTSSPRIVQSRISPSCYQVSFSPDMNTTDDTWGQFVDLDETMNDAI
mmetsp:Transcript_9583/g.10640  ORF Transcript_9583/g.10640 Transcript_9583/m.10640 type:complete len:89 (-) Transcript_9583:324-590(-)